MRIDTKKSKRIANSKIALAAIVVGILFWFIEAFIHVYVFHHANLLSEIITPGAHEIWMRALVVLIIIVFGIITQTILNRHTRLEKIALMSEKKYHTLFENAPAAITLVDTTGTIVDCNTATETLTGFSRKELIGQQFEGHLTLDPKDMPQLRERFERLQKGLEVKPYEVDITTKDGTKKSINIISSTLFDEGKVTGIQIIASDITEHKRADILLQRSEHEKSLILSSTADLISFQNNRLELIWANRAAGESVNMNVEQLIGKHCYEIWQKKTAPCTGCPVVKAMETGQPQHFEMTTPDGRIWYLSGYPVRNEAGEITGAVEVTREVTEQRLAEQALHESEEKFRTLAEKSPNMIFINKGGRVVYVNRKCEEAVGYTRDEFYSPNFGFLSIIAPKHHELLKANFAKHLKGEDIEPYEYSLITKSGTEIAAIITTKLIDYEDDKAILGIVTDVTELKKMEAALKESEVKYRFIVEHQNDLVVKFSSDNTLLFANPMYLKTFGKKEEDIIGKPLMPLDSEEARDKFTENVAALAKKPHVDYFERQQETVNGRRWFGWSSSAILDDNGQVKEIVSVGRDITERRHATDELRNREERLRQFFEKVPEYCYIVSPDGIIMDANAAALKALAYKKKELVGKPVKSIYAPESSAKAERLFAKWKETGQIRNEELEIITKDGDKRTVLLSVDAVRTADGNVIHSVSLQRDITDWKQAESALLQSELRYRSLFDRSLLCIYIHDFEGNFLDANDAALDLLGYTREDIPSINLGTLLSKDQLEIAFSKTREILEKGYQESLGEYKLRKKDGGHVWVETEAVLLSRNEQPYAIQGVARDITERKEAEEALRYRLELEKVVANISTRFITLGSDRIDDGINHALEEIGKFAGAGRSYVFRLHDNDTMMSLTHEWCAEGVTPQIQQLQGLKVKDFPWGFNQLIEGKVLSIPSVASMPTEDSEARKVLQSAGVKSLLSVHMYIGGSVKGFIGLDAVREERTWSEDLVSLLKTVSGMLTNALERKEAEIGLLDSEDRYRRLVNRSFDGIGVHQDGKIIYMNAAGAKLLGATDPEQISGISITQIVHPGQHQALLRNMQQIGNGLPVGPGETKFLRLDGKIIDVEVLGIPIIHENKPAVQVVFRDITERKLAEQALRESERKYRDLVEDINDITYSVNRDGVLTYISPVLETVTGIKPEDVVGKKVSELIPKPYQQKYQELFRRHIEEGVSAPMELDMVTTTGKHLWLQVSNKVIRSGEQITGSRGVITDITQRKQAEKALQESEDRYRALYETAPEAMMLFDVNGVIVHCNDAATRIAHMSKQSLIGKHFKDLGIIDAESLPRLVHVFSQAITGKNVGIVDITIKPHGRDPVLLQAFPAVLKRNHEITALQIIFRDMTESIKMEQNLKKAARQWNTTFDAIRDLICLVDLDGQILRCNRTVTQIAGKEFRDIIGHKCCEIVHGRTEPEENCPLKIMTEKHQRVTEITQTPDGRWLSTSADPIVDEKGIPTGAVLIMSDITDQKKMEEELLKAQKLESLSILAGGIAHDFNNILASILGNIEISKIYSSPSSDNLDRLRKAETATLRAKDLVQQLLTFSKGGAPIKTPQSIVDIIRDTTEFALRGSMVKCNYDVVGDIWPVEVDEGQMSQVVNNLIINAVQAMPQGGSIDIGVENISLKPDSGLPLSAGDYIKISITDHGSGVPPENIQKIFDPYFTTKARGSGLGLATTYSIMKKHDGHISVESSSEAGTTFSLYLPASSRKPHAKPEIKNDEPIAGRGRILVMDDEEEIRDIVSQMLKHCGYQVALAKDGVEAIEIYKKEHDAGRAFDLVIMDLTVPGGMGGKEAIKGLKEIDPDAKVIVSSGYSTDPILGHYVEYGFCGAISKPYKINELSQVLDRLLGAGK